MRIPVDAFGPAIRGSLSDWPGKILWAKSHGYTGVEISMAPLEVIFAGNSNPLRLQVAEKLFLNCGLAISVHQPSVLDLRSRTDGNTHLAVAQACVDFAEHVGSGILVVHYTRELPLREDEGILADRIRCLAEYAQPRGVTLAIENIETAPAEAVAEMVDRLSLANVGMTYDLGHDWLAARRFGYDFLGSAERVAPYVRHIHLHDNFGIYAELRLSNFTVYNTIPYSDWLPLGQGDLHLPVGWGNVPFDRVIDLLSPYNGMVISEHRIDKFAAENREIARRVAQEAKRLWSRVGEKPARGSRSGNDNGH